MRFAFVGFASKVLIATLSCVLQAPYDVVLNDSRRFRVPRRAEAASIYRAVAAVLGFGKTQRLD